MINPTTKVSATKLKGFNAILPLQLMVLLEEHHKTKLYNELGLV